MGAVGADVGQGLAMEQRAVKLTAAAAAGGAAGGGGGGGRMPPRSVQVGPAHPSHPGQRWHLSWAELLTPICWRHPCRC